MSERQYPVADETTLRRAGWGCVLLISVLGIVLGLAFHYAGRFLDDLDSVEEAAPEGVPGPEASTGQGGATVLRWQTSYEAGVLQANREGKPMLVSFEADWAAGATRMREEVYTDPAVVAELQRFVLVRLSLGDSPALEERLGVTGAPHVVFLSSTGEPIGEGLPGEVDAPTLRQALP